MNITGLGAEQGYFQAKKALAPESIKDNKLQNNPDANNEKNIAARGIEEFSEVFKNVENTMQAHISGQADAHLVVEAIANAELALETAVTIRNRVVEAYQELLRMPA